MKTTDWLYAFLPCWAFLTFSHAFGINCRGSDLCSHKLDKWSNPNDWSRNLVDYISQIPDDVFIPPDLLIACTGAICAWVTKPCLGHPAGLKATQIRHMANQLVYKHQCKRCGEVATGWPANKKDYRSQAFCAGSLKFDYVHEGWQKNGCGTQEGLCKDWAGLGQENGRSSKS